MIPRTFDELFEPQITLVLEESYGGYFTVTDQHGRIYFPPTRSLDVAVRFMRAMQAKGHAVLDEDSIEWHRCLREFGDWSVKAPGVLGEVPAVTGDDGTGTSPSNVVPLRRRDIA